MMKTRDHLVQVRCLVILFYILPVVAAHSTLNYFETNSGEKVKGELTDILEATSASLLHCANHCANIASCKSASYHEEDGSCLLSTYRVDGPANQGRLITRQSWTALSKQGGNIPMTTAHQQSASTTTAWAGTNSTPTQSGTTTGPSLPTAVCSGNWVGIGQTCYLFYNSSLQEYSKATNYCVEQGGKLAEPQTNATFELLRNYMVANLAHTTFWFGVNDLNTEGDFVWASTGGTVGYTAWGSSINNKRSKNCVDLYQAQDYKWYLFSCSSTEGVVCEKPG